MHRKKISLKIKHRKKLLNFLLRFLSPNNRFMIILSQNLDKYITLYQLYLSKKYYIKKKREKIFISMEKKSA